MIYDLVIIGGGASGLMAAVTALEKKLNVLILEKGSKLGRKILASGNGRCNFTHETVLLNDYQTDDKDALRNILQQYSVRDVVHKFMELGMYTRNKNGYLYPCTESAITVLEVLTHRIKELHGQIRTDSKVCRINKRENYFEVIGEAYRVLAKTVIFATGSKAGGFYRDMDSTPYELGEAFGLRTTKLYPSLTRLLCKEQFLKELAGIRIQATVSLYENGQRILEEKGEVQFTKNSVSGIVVFQLSGVAAQSLDLGNVLEVHMNFLQELNIDNPRKWLMQRMKMIQNRTIEEFFLGILPRKIILQCILNAGINEKLLVKNLTLQDCLKVYHQMEAFCVHIVSVDTMENAQVCRGGFYVNQFDEHLQSKNCPGLFSCGEVLNVDGKCGGYNLHFAWISGMIAANGVLHYLENNGISEINSSH